MHIYIYICIYIYSIFIYLFVYICMCVCIYIYTHTVVRKPECERVLCRDQGAHATEESEAERLPNSGVKETEGPIVGLRV